MKKTLIALATVAVTGVASAQMTVYGVLDSGITQTNGTTTFTSGVNGSPRIGFKGSEDLGNGLKAAFVIETGFNMGSETATSIGDRGARLAVTGSFGTVEIGSSILSASFFTKAAFDVTGTNSYSIGSYGGATRNDKSINYTNSFGPVTARASFTLNDDNAGAGATDIGLVYAAGPLAVGYSTSSATGKTSGTMMGASYDLGVAKVAASQVKSLVATGTAQETTTAFEVAVPVGSASVQFQNSKAKNTSVKTNMLAVEYPLSKATKLTAYSRKATSSDAVTGFGIRHNF